MRALLPFAALTVALVSPANSTGTIYALDSGRSLYTLDLTTAAKTLVGTVSANASTVGSLTRDPASGTVYLSSTILHQLFTLDLATGNATLVGPYTNASFVHGTEWDPSTGTLYATTGSNFYTVNTSTGTATLVGPTGLASFGNLCYFPTTDTLYATNTGTDSTYTVNRATGAMTLVGALGAGVANPHGLAFNPDDGKVYLVDSNTDTLYTIDLATGAATVIGSTGTGNLLALLYVPDPNPGVAYCFGDGSGTPCPCTPVPLMGDADKGCPNGFNAGGGKLTASGSASIGADTLVLTCTTINNGGAVIFQGTNDNGGGLGTAFGDGLRCASGTVRRMRSHSVTTNTHQYPDPAFADNAISIRGAVLAPGDRWYQGWYRSGLAHCDPTQNYNLTNGVKITWAP